MDIEKKTEIICRTQDGETLNNGDEVMFEADGKSIVGTFEGLTPKGAVQFGNMLENTTFAFMPKSIQKIVKVNVGILCTEGEYGVLQH